MLLEKKYASDLKCIILLIKTTLIAYTHIKLIACYISFFCAATGKEEVRTLKR
jgi:hypothetical protein